MQIRTETGGLREVVVVEMLVLVYTVKQKENNGLERRHNELLVAFRELCLELAMRKRVLELQLAA